MCEELCCIVKNGYYYCKETRERCPDGLFDKTPPKTHTDKLGTDYTHKGRRDWDFYTKGKDK